MPIHKEKGASRVNAWMKVGICIVSLAGGAAVGRAEDISEKGWRLWPDREAVWKEDAIYLPREVDLARLPVNPPTGGWAALNDQQGIPVTLPTTVEEHYWGKLGLRPYTKFESQRASSSDLRIGNYLGISWWWREIRVPKFQPGQRVVASFRGARLRAEVYCNGKLCGYSIMGELPFKADLTGAVEPGKKALLALRITNPGGHLDWIDFPQMRLQWGRYTLPPSHGFGGLDNDIQLEVRDNVSLVDLAAINKPDLKEVHLVADIASVNEAYNGQVDFTISRKGKQCWSGESAVQVESGKTVTVELDARLESAEPWDVNNPNLYTLTASLRDRKASGRRLEFGFRYFTAEGIGSADAKLTLNGKRIVPISAISWGFWGRNGLWPDREMAEREVVNAKKLGLNCLQFHRNIGRPAILDLQDRMGLLRCEEPGGGKFILGHRYSEGPFKTNGEFVVADDYPAKILNQKRGYVLPESVDTSGAGPDGDGVTFWEKYAEEKLVEMVKRDRSHPSLIMYTIQNESSHMDLRNPRIYRVMRRMHELDPSRIIAFYSGGDPAISQVLMLPYSDQIQAASSNCLYAGWKDMHSCGGPCNYMDYLYKNPREFRQKQPESSRKSICVWGEMLGSGCPDDYEQIVKAFGRKYKSGYELADMTRIRDGYHQFLDKWGFRQAFPTESSLFQAIGYRTYYFWRRIVEQSRMDNANDYLVISGWESTTVDNHSGIVDNHRFLKGDPSVLAEACQPELLVIQPRRMIVAKGETEMVDLFLINETGRRGPCTLTFKARRPDGSIAYTVDKQVDVRGGDVYGQLLVEGIEFQADAAGMVTLEATLSSPERGVKPLKRKDQIHVVDMAGIPLLKQIAVVEQDREIAGVLKEVFGVTAAVLTNVPAAERLDAIVLSTKSSDSDLFKPVVMNTNAAGAKAGKPNEQKSAISGGRIVFTKDVFEQALNRVKNDGTRLVLWPDNNRGAQAFVRELSKRGIVKSKAWVGSRTAPWLGNWFFVRDHWLLAGLPVDCAMDWRYGISSFHGPEWLEENPKIGHADGADLEAEGLEVFVGFGADHNPRVGMSGCVIPYGKGQIVLYCLPQMVSSLNPGYYSMSPVICRRLLGNALQAR